MRIRLILMVLVFAAVSFATGCDAVDGERSVSGQIPPEPKTLEVEEACSRLALPAESTRLKTNIISKSYQGNVTNTYSTDHSCSDISSFFKNSLASDRWIQVENGKYGLLDMGFRSVFASKAYSVEITCDDLPDYKGITRFTVSCFWERD